jgi:hypothetical protein
VVTSGGGMVSELCCGSTGRGVIGLRQACAAWIALRCTGSSGTNHSRIHINNGVMRELCCISLKMIVLVFQTITYTSLQFMSSRKCTSCAVNMGKDGH